MLRSIESGGSKTLNAFPLEGVDSTEMTESWVSAIDFAIESPSPLPVLSSERDLSAR